MCEQSLFYQSQQRNLWGMYAKSLSRVAIKDPRPVPSLKHIGSFLVCFKIKPDLIVGLW
jgi:hypothetical protein